ncbi:MAG: hypothetical protein KKG01_02540 [Candidatus Omnitrophica bacterium]|nr:hypothetical protein [Candidatus Omnitrophota bacterium]MBU4589780.1 hypothetical protein [Candidatus Omnitrophota bacterium]
MRRFSFFLLGIISIFILQSNCGCQEQAEDEVDATTYPTTHVSGEIVVKFKPEAFDEEEKLIAESILELNEKYEVVSIERVFKTKPVRDLSNIYILEFAEDIDIMGLVQAYEEDPNVVYAEPNYIMHTQDAD